MTRRQFISAVGYLPANIFSGLVNLIFGATNTDDDGKMLINEKTGEPEIVPSLLGLILDGIRSLGREVGDFIANHKKAIAVAGWLSLLLASGTALTLFLWPGALATVAAFTIANISILSLVGESTALQIAAATALVSFAASLAVYLTASIANTATWIKACFQRPAAESESESDDEDYAANELSNTEHGPGHFPSPLNSPQKSRSKELNQEPSFTPNQGFNPK